MANDDVNTPVVAAGDDDDGDDFVVEPQNPGDATFVPFTDTFEGQRVTGDADEHPGG